MDTGRFVMFAVAVDAAITEEDITRSTLTLVLAGPNVCDFFMRAEYCFHDITALAVRAMRAPRMST